MEVWHADVCKEKTCSFLQSNHPTRCHGSTSYFFSSACLIEKPYFQDHDIKDTERIEIVLGRKNPWSRIVTLYTCAKRFQELRSWVVSPTFISLLHTVKQDL
jgi:hypothetical protein